MSTKPPSGPDPHIEARIEQYLERKPRTKTSVKSCEVYRQLGLTQRKASDALAHLSEREGTMVGERMKRGEDARWRVNR